MYRGLIVVAVVVSALAMLAGPGAAEDKEKAPATIKLFNGKNLDGWKKFVDPKSKADPETVWKVKDEMIICKGVPFGYIITEKEYGDYVLKVQWRWAKDGDNDKRNSGVFVHVIGKDKIWPKGVEAQLYRDHAGEFWLVDGFKLKVDESRQNPKSKNNYFRIDKDKKVEKPIGEWNEYVITCEGDKIKVAVNGKLQNEGTDAETTKGKILLQSEGAEVHFRNIELSPLKAPKE
jgi:hypothetical protein